MATFTNTNKSSAPTWTGVTKPSTASISAGNPIGLLLVLTYAAPTGESSWTSSSKNSSTWTNASKN